MKEIKIALVGNPNCGKTTMFNELTGSKQYVGNWPGVTVEKKEGRLKGHDDVIVTDLPGIYSLSPYTLEEVISRNYLLDNNVDTILNLVDGSNIERNLYLTTQGLEMGIPVQKWGPFGYRALDKRAGLHHCGNLCPAWGGYKKCGRGCYCCSQWQCS